MARTGRMKTSILLSVLLASVLLIGVNSHFTGRQMSFPSPLMPQSFSHGLCVSLVRRIVMGSQTVTYPCFQPIPGVVPQVAHQSPMGLVCQGVARVPKMGYQNVLTCCPGWNRDKAGRCVKRTMEGPLIVQKTLQPRIPSTSQLQSFGLPEQSQQKQVTPSIIQALQQAQKAKSPVISHSHAHEHSHAQDPMHALMHEHGIPHVHTEDKQKAHALMHAHGIPHTHPEDTQQPRDPHAEGLEHLTPYPASTPEEKRAKLMEILQKQPLAMLGNSMMQWAPRAMIQKQLEMRRRKKLADTLMKIKALREAKEAWKKEQQRAIRRRQMMLMSQRPPVRSMGFIPARRMAIRLVPKGVLRLHIIRTLKPMLSIIREALSIPDVVNRVKDSETPSSVNDNFVAPTTEKPFPLIPKPSVQNGQIPVSAGFIEGIPGPIFLKKLVTTLQNAGRTADQDNPMPDIAINDLRPQPNTNALPFPELPKIPLELPPVQVQPGPNSQFNGLPLCFVNYVRTVKKCLSEAKVELPTEHNFLPGQSTYDQSGVCEKRQMIKDCINKNLQSCDDDFGDMLVTNTLAETMTEIDRDCQLHDLDSIESRLVPVEKPKRKIVKTLKSREMVPKHKVHAHDEQPVDSVQSQLELLQPVITMETLPNIDKKPVDPKPEPVTPPKEPEHKTDSPKVEVPVVEEKPVEPVHAHPNPDAQSDPLVHVHDIRVEETSKDTYLPLLIGMAIGVAAIIILLSALLCICCRRRIKKKVYIEKEPEKPKLFDGVYTIGLPPPIYEVNGIPPISYEEAKGEKITGSPSSLRRHNVENEAQETTSVKGCVSDI